MRDAVTAFQAALLPSQAPPSPQLGGTAVHALFLVSVLCLPTFQRPRCSLWRHLRFSLHVTRQTLREGTRTPAYLFPERRRSAPRARKTPRPPQPRGAPVGVRPPLCGPWTLISITFPGPVSPSAARESADTRLCPNGVSGSREDAGLQHRVGKPPSHGCHVELSSRLTGPLLLCRGS